MRKSIIISFLLIYLANSYIAAASEPTIEQLFKDALDAKGQAYINVRQKILNLLPRNEIFLKEQAKSTDLQTRIIAQSILERAAKPQEYRHLEELMIVPITVASKYGRNFRRLVNPFDTIKEITQIPKTSRSLENRRTAIDAGVGTPSQTNYHSYCHDDSAFLFMAEMAMKDTMLDLPELSEQIEWTDEQKTYNLNEAAVMLGVLPQTAEKLHKAGLFLIQWNRPRFFVPMQTDSNDLPNSINQSQIRNFYEYFSDKVINPEYLKSTQPVSRVVHSDYQFATKQFRQDPGSLSRCYAILMLRNFSNKEISELLYEIYKDDISEYVRTYCVEGFSAQTQVEQIREAMKDYSLVVESDDSETTDIPVEQKTTKVPCARVRIAAIIKSEENPDVFTASDYIRAIIPGNRDLNAVIAQILITKGDITAIEPLIDMFSGSSSTNRVIAKAIIAIDPNSMYKALEHQEEDIRKSAWSSLGSSDVDFPLEFEYLVAHLNDDSIINSIMYLIEENYPDSLVSFLDNKNPTVMIRAISLLGQNPQKYIQEGSPSLKELLLVHVQDSNPSIRRAVLIALSRYSSDERVYVIFLDALKDTSSECRIAAINNLKASAETVSILDVFLMQEKDSYVRTKAAQHLSSFNETSKYKVFIKLVSDESYEVRRVVARELSDWGDDQVIEIMELLLNDSDLWVQQIAFAYIAKNDIGLLKEIITNAEPILRQKAYDSLREVKSEEAAALLIEGTKDENADVRQSTLSALMKQKYSKELDDPVVSAVRKCLSDDNPKVRSNAIYVLYEMVGDKSFEIITGYLYDPDTSVKITAIGTLMRFDNSGILKYLMEALAKEEDKETLVELVRALQTITGNLLTKDEWMQWWSENKDTYLTPEK